MTLAARTMPGSYEVLSFIPDREKVMSLKAGTHFGSYEILAG